MLLSFTEIEECKDENHYISITKNNSNITIVILVLKFTYVIVHEVVEDKQFNRFRPVYSWC